MPSSWGTEQNSPAASGYDIAQFTKWFDMMELDFEILRQAGRWNVTCWTRNDMKFIASSSGHQLDDALMGLYSQANKIRRSAS
jgi:hypothetical protein